MEKGRGVQQQIGTRGRSDASRLSWARWRGSTGWYAWRVAAAGVAIACAASVTALAATRYSVGVSVSSPVLSGHSFTVKARGVVPQRARLEVDLNTKPCRATSGVGAYTSGESYFLQNHGGHMVKETWEYAWISGPGGPRSGRLRAFETSFTAYAGTATGREYACAYLDRANKNGVYQVTAAHASASYTVKR